MEFHYVKREELNEKTFSFHDGIGKYMRTEWL